MREKHISESPYALFAQEIREMIKKDQEMRTRALSNGGVIESEEDDTLDVRKLEKKFQIWQSFSYDMLIMTWNFKNNALRS